MAEAFGEVLPLSLVIALSPIPIVAVIAMLFSRRAVGNGLAFLVGWIVGVAGGLTVLTFLVSPWDLGTEEDPSSEASLLRLVLGLALLAWAARSWRKRPAPGETAAVPPWMAKAEAASPARALRLAIVLGGLNPKNLMVNVAAATALGAADVEPVQAVGVIALYTAVASSSVAVAVGYRLIAGQGAVAALERMRTWLVANNATIMAVLLLVLGAKVIGDALAG